MGQLFGGFLLVYLVSKLIQKLLAKYTSFTPIKALTVGISISVVLCSVVASFKMGVVSFIIYPLGGIGAWFYGIRNIKKHSKQANGVRP